MDAKETHSEGRKCIAIKRHIKQCLRAEVRTAEDGSDQFDGKKETFSLWDPAEGQDRI